ncbi:MAG: hypothetical protein OXU66_00830 [Gammaproteobacteria bacterium]|nr:hypothetical protein [Gammaproteobacteria bacterium]MDD9895049.1 hypothetical protein [Gammaproteobacteria bacterium]MDD9957459.1 hypothetical protein [Gammaproteobacteria bacterium]
MLSILTFTGDTGNAVVGGFLWLALAFAFAISAIFLSKREEKAEGAEVASSTEADGE